MPSLPSPSASEPAVDDAVVVNGPSLSTGPVMPPARMMTLDPTIGGKAAQGSTGSVVVVVARFEEEPSDLGGASDDGEPAEAKAKFHLVVDSPECDAAELDVDAPISPPPMFSNSAIAIEALNAL